MYTEWRLRDLEDATKEATRRLHEIDSLRSDVGRLECALRDSRAEVDGLRAQLETMQDAVIQLQQRALEAATA